jgi:long-subunit fatty acid transport protein
MKLGVGLEYRLLDNRLLLSAEYRFEKTSDYKKENINEVNYKDRHNVHLGVEYKTNNNISVRTGFFTQFDIRDTTGGVTYLDPIGDYDQYNLTLGVGYKYKDYNFNVAFIDAFSDKTSHLNINLGMLYDF